MQTKNGQDIATLLNVDIMSSSLTLTIHVGEDVKDTENGMFADMLEHIEQRITENKKPSKSYEKLLESISIQREQLADFYTRLFILYQETTDIKVRTRKSPKDAKTVEMLSIMPDKMLREFVAIKIGADVANEFILPDDREKLYEAYVMADKAE